MYTLYLGMYLNPLGRTKKERGGGREAGAAGGEAGEKADGRAGEGWGGLQA